MSEVVPQSTLNTSESTRTKRWEMLRLLDWSFITPPHVRGASHERIDELYHLVHTDERVVRVAYYALELSDNRLPPLEDATKSLERLRTGTAEAVTLVDNFILATAVNDELWEAYSGYQPSMETALRQITSDYTARNVGWLRAIQRMRSSSDSRQRVGTVTARSAEMVARMAIASEPGVALSGVTANRKASVE